MECCKKGYFSEKDFVFPSEERLKKKAVAVAECGQEIPCNPCVEACPFGAIEIHENINSKPEINYEKCTGCGLCLGVCPGLSLFLMDLSKNDGARITIPYELFPPKEGEEVELLGRDGNTLGIGIIDKVKEMKKHDKTLLITLKFNDKDLIYKVRGFRSKK